MPELAIHFFLSPYCNIKTNLPCRPICLTIPKVIYFYIKLLAAWFKKRNNKSEIVFNSVKVPAWNADQKPYRRSVCVFYDGNIYRSLCPGRNVFHRQISALSSDHWTSSFQKLFCFTKFVMPSRLILRFPSKRITILCTIYFDRKWILFLPF